MCHAESRIIEELFSGFGSSPGGTLTLKIRWKKGKKIRDTPCKEHCEAMLCAAKACGLKIMICRNGDDKPTEFSCD
jgi:hypothetical protein